MTEILTQPGYITEFTERGAKGRWIGGDNTRFRNALPEKIGGCQRLTSTPFLGICRRMRNFKSLDLDKYLALATNKRFYVYDGGELVNVTPERDSGTLSNPFSTTAGSNLITVADNGHGVTEGDIINFSNATASPTDGILVDGDYEVVSVIDANSYRIQHATTATNSESGFGDSSVDYVYEINSGLADSMVGTGWGGGAWNTGTWNTPRTGSGINFPLRTVSIDEWGEDVIWNVRAGGIYVFDTSAGINPANRATLIAEAPETAQSIIVSPEDRHLIALGAHNGSDSDPMLVAWCSQEDYTDWLPSALNTAGDKRLDKGTRIMLGMLVRGQILILTDTSAYSMFFIGYPEVFGFDFKASECGAISPMAGVSHNDVGYWMGDKNFWLYDGSPAIIPCEIRNYVFGMIDLTQKEKVYCGLVTAFDEVWWVIPKIGGGYIWVVYNIPGKFFFFGSFDDWETPRSAWLDNGEYSNKPISAGEDGYLWVQETGVNHGASALPSYIERFYDEVGEGDDVAMTSLVMPDFRQITGTVKVSMRGKKYAPDDDGREIVKGPYDFTASTRKKNIRIRARQISIKIETEGLGDDWKFGTLRATTFPMGKK